MLVDRAQLLTLTAPEMTVLVGGLRVLDTNYVSPAWGFHEAAGGAHQRFLCQPAQDEHKHEVGSSFRGDVFVARDPATGEKKWAGTRVDLIFGSNSQLRALAEAYATDDAAGAFVDAFVAAWSKVMDLDRFDLA